MQLKIKAIISLAIVVIAVNISIIHTFAQPKYEITSVIKEKFLDKQGRPLTGKGVVVGDVDSGVDIFHPMFFFADGGEFDWIDVDGDGKFTIGVDGVDLNKDGKISSDEILRYIEIKDNTYGMVATLGESPNRFDLDFDFLYADKNGNKKRDFGPAAGFTENDPAYGEPLFIALDANQNGRLDPGQKLAMLKTSKFRAIRERTGNIRRRGVDLIYTEEDSVGHGTGVAGLILGGTYGVSKIHGIAPDAEMIISSIRYDYTPRFVRNFTDLVGFLKDEKVNILLFEDGEWMWETMDGSSPEEEMVNQMARDGVTVIGGAGNFADGKMMIVDTLKAGNKVTYSANCPPASEDKKNDGVFFSFLWRTPDDKISFTIQAPDKNSSEEITDGTGFIKVGDYNIFYGREVSPKGTAMFKLACSRTDSGTVKGSWKISLKSEKDEMIQAFIVDVSQSWGGTSRWISDKLTGDYSICFPSTGDSVMAIGAYTVNFGWNDRIGDLCSYSSRGYTITGKLAVDICAPGHSTFSLEKNNGWQIFSGTSSAAPHVVGTAALLLQYNPALTHEQIRQILHNSAVSDNFTGTVPNVKWGYGKLDIEGAVKYAQKNY